MWNMSYRLATSCQHTQQAVWFGGRHHLEGSIFRSGDRHLVSGADGLLTVELAHSGELDEAVVVKVVVDAQMVAVPEEETQSLGRSSKNTQQKRKEKTTDLAK